jgi:hypothetical protein
MKKIIVCTVILLCLILVILSEIANGRNVSASLAGDIEAFGASDRTFEKTFEAVPGQTLTINTDQGSIRIEGTSENKVSVKAELKGSEKQINDFEITANTTSQGVEITGTRKSKGWSDFWNNFDVSYTIKVPKEYQIDAETAGGNIKVNSLNGNVTGRTSGGNLILTEVNGQIQIKTSGGNIELSNIEGTTVAKTSGGNIEIEKVSGSLDVHTSGGNIRAAAVSGFLQAETSGGNIHVNVTSAYKGIQVETSGGDIEIQVPADIKADLDAHTSGGEVECDGLEVTVTGKIESDRIKGKIHGGGELIRARTSGGDIFIRAMK